MKKPIATYRIQLNRAFDFDRAASELSYLKALGISHLYASPCLTAVKGSMHGYDVADFRQVNPELGGSDAHARLWTTLHALGMGQLLDIVPNHMAAHPRENRLWRDVLRLGESSLHAGFFDIRWQTQDAKTDHKVLVPILGDHYDACLREGQLQLARHDSEISLTYYDHDLPLSPTAVNALLEMAEKQHPRSGEGEKSGGIADCGESVDTLLSEINKNPDRIHDLLEQCHFRLAYWRTATTDINYRRFFDINELVGLCMETPAVFDAAHDLVFKWMEAGWINGLRIDHPDGLSDPEAYLERVYRRASNRWIIVEKILEQDETLPESWPVSGTTGYDFLNHVNGLFVDPENERRLTRLYEDFTGESPDYKETVRRKKHLVLEKSFQSDLRDLADRLQDIRFAHRRYRDLTRIELSGALKEIIACFPVYRTYVRPHAHAEGFQISRQDHHQITEAVSLAKRRQPNADPLIFELIENLLRMKLSGTAEAEFVTRFQQLTGPAMAKGVEDTTFYCFNRLISLNEVGGNPGVFGTSVDGFHRHCDYIQQHHPQTLSATATHDTKRGEDTRIRIDLLSEIPDQWAAAVHRWEKITSGYRTDKMPDASTRYFLFQTLTGTWPIDSERLTAYMQKAAKEAKVHTSWTNPDAAFEMALTAFIEKSLADEGFVSDVDAFVSTLLHPARISSLSQTLIKCTAPGIPDIYQGTELWDFSLVDPDNRRPVDFSYRRNLLSQLDGRTGPEILPQLHTGLPKLFVIQAALAVRQRFPGAFDENGTYRALEIKGSKSKHGVAFCRGETCVTIAPRLVIGLNSDWRDTAVCLPAGSWENVLTRERWDAGDLRLDAVLSRFPVALLVKS